MASPEVLAEQTYEENIPEYSQFDHMAMYGQAALSNASERMGEMKDNAVRIAATALAIGSVVGLHASEATGDTNSYPRSDSREVHAKSAKLFKKCMSEDVLSVNQFFNGPPFDGDVKHNKYGSLKVYNINENHRQKFKWNFKKGYVLCGLIAQRDDFTTMFPSKKPSRVGTFTDPSTIEDAGRIDTMVALIRKQK